MIMCGDKTDIGGGDVEVGYGFPPQRDIRWREERSGRSKNKYITISDVA